MDSSAHTNVTDGVEKHRRRPPFAADPDPCNVDLESVSEGPASRDPSRPVGPALSDALATSLALAHSRPAAISTGLLVSLEGLDMLHRITSQAHQQEGPQVLRCLAQITLQSCTLRRSLG